MNAATKATIPAAATRVRIRHTHFDDVLTLIALQKKIYPSIDPWSVDIFSRQIETFPHGQLVAELDGKIVGCTSSLVILWDDWATEHTWQEVTASGSFATHDIAGRTLYGAEVFVAPGLRGAGIGRALYQGRRRICRAMNLKRIIACGRLPGYHRHASEMSPETYAMKVIWGDFNDAVLSFQLRQGFRYCGIVKGYLLQDVESGGAAALIVWLNSRYNPQLPTLFPGAPLFPDSE